MSARGQAPGGLDQLAHRPHPTAVCGGDGEKSKWGSATGFAVKSWKQYL